MHNLPFLSRKIEFYFHRLNKIIDSLTEAFACRILFFENFPLLMIIVMFINCHFYSKMITYNLDEDSLICPKLEVFMDRNIFEAAAKKSKGHKKKQNHQASSQQEQNIPSQETARQDIPETDVAEMFNRMHEMQKDLEKKLADIYERGKNANVNVDLLLQKYHLLPGNIEKVQLEQKQLSEQINAIITPESCVKKISKSKEKLTKERKNKTIGARKKWIPVH